MVPRAALQVPNQLYNRVHMKPKRLATEQHACISFGRLSAQ